MTGAVGIAAALLLVAGACKKEAEKENEKKEPGTDTGTGTGSSKAAPVADAGAGAVAVVAVDAGAAADAAAEPDAGAAPAAAAADAGAAAVAPATPSGPAPSGVYFLTRTALSTTEIVGAPPSLAPMTGRRVSLYGADGYVCDATVGEAVEQPGDYASAALDSPSEPCDDALIAVPAGAPRKIVKIRSADDWDAEAAFEESDRGQDASAKAELEDLPGIKYISVRKLVPKEGPALALLYMTIHGHRSIGVFSVPGAGFENAAFLSDVQAPAPSEVIGLDVDGDGLLDAVIGHAEGGAVILGKDGGVQLDPDGQFGAVW